VDLAQFGLGDSRVAAVEGVVHAVQRDAGAERGPAVRREVLGAGDHAIRRAGVVALVAADGGFAEGRDERGILREALVRAAPAVIARDGHGGREGPVDARRADLSRGDVRDLLHEVRVARRAQPDVVREDHGADHVGVPVHSVHAVQQRDAEPGLAREVLISLDHRGPVLAAVGDRV